MPWARGFSQFAAGGAVLVLITINTAPMVAAQQSDADRQLAERYAPIVAVRAQPEECGSGEPFRPVAVDVVLGNPDVALRDPDGKVIKQGPTAADIAGLGEDRYLDLPGNALAPKCDYERWFDKVAAGKPTTLYARVATDPDHPGQIALQYWFYWVYNDWNDRHEGDWEMVQLLFDAPDAQAALGQEPTEMAYAQHEGGETAAWDAAKLEKADGHPIVYPGEGSHAAYFSSNRWFGKSAATGFGCDDTRGPTELLQPQIIMLPAKVTGADDPFAWLGFSGHWGQKAPSFNNGPTGPTTKTQWAAPVTWQEEEGRDSALSLPPIGGRATDLFCSASRQGSLLFIRVLDHPIITIPLLGLAGLGLVIGLRRTKWSPIDLEPIPQRRAGGQIVRAAARLVRQHTGLYVGIGLVMVVGGLLAAGVQKLLLEFTSFGTAVSVAGDTSGWAASLVLALAGIMLLPFLMLVLAGAAAATRALAAGESPTAVSSLRAAIRPAGGWLAGIVLAVVFGLATGAVVLIPVALWVLACWAVVVPAGVHEGLGTVDSLGRSVVLTKGSRGRVLLRVLGIGFLGLLLGPLVGALLLLLTGVGFTFVNVLAMFFLAVTVPFAGVALSLLYHDLAIGSTEAAGGEHPVPDDAAMASASS